MALLVGGGTRSATFENQSEFFRKESTKLLLTLQSIQAILLITLLSPENLMRIFLTLIKQASAFWRG